MNKDLTVGAPDKVLRQFCIPLLGSIIFQQLYNIADSLVAGKFIGENALAAVGNSYEITLIFLAFAFGCNMGCSVIVSQLFGAKDYKGVKTAVYTASIFSAAVCAALMILGVTCCDGLLRLIRTPKSWRTLSCIWTSMSMACPSSSSITSPPAFSPPWAIPRHPSIFWRSPLFPILPWISFLSRRSGWG